MSVIRPLKPREERHICPDCGAPEGLILGTNRHLQCTLCGWSAPEIIGEINDPTDQAEDGIADDIRDIRQMKISYFITNRSDITTWGSAAYDTAIDSIKRRQWDDAIKSLYRALDNDPEFLEAHLWLGRLLTDEEKQREHLSHVIAHKPQHAEALLEMMYLNGQISLTQLERALYENGEVEVIDAPAPVQSDTVILSCPVCGGDMTTHPLTGHTECAFCGHLHEAELEQSTVGGSLTVALLQQRSEGVKWVIGERILSCNNCGAQRTIPNTRMGSYCMYCGSNHVIEKDALNSFRQPEGVIPFTIPQETAEQAIYDKLTGGWERFKGMFVNNAVKQATFTGTFLPFWLFDMIFDVNITYRLTGESAVRYGAPPVRSETRPDVVNNFPLPGVLSPSPRLIDKISRYDFTKIRPYEPSVLARYPAEIYQIDFDKASLEARGRVRRLMKDRHENEKNPFATEEIISVGIQVNNITFRLVLLPVWIATLIEDDGDVRIGLVNGQTGQAVLGKARKPQKIT